MNYHNLTYPDMNNGDGLRVVLWLSGCNHHCYNCHNSQTWDANSGIPFDESAKEELFRELDKDYISGLTLTGGDPLFESNLDDVLDLVKKIRFSLSQKSIWLYTGYYVREIYKGCFIFSPSAADIVKKGLDGEIVAESIKDQKRDEIVKQCTVLVDGRYIDEQRDISLPFRGSRNQRIIDVKKSVETGEIVLWRC